MSMIMRLSLPLDSTAFVNAIELTWIDRLASENNLLKTDKFALRADPIESLKTLRSGSFWYLLKMLQLFALQLSPNGE